VKPRKDRGEVDVEQRLPARFEVRRDRPGDAAAVAALVAASTEAFQFEAAKLSLRDHECVVYRPGFVTRRLGSTPASAAWRRSMYRSNCGTVKSA
jgi:hypothetical protein